MSEVTISEDQIISHFLAQVTEEKATVDGGFRVILEGGIGNLEHAAQAAFLFPFAVAGAPVEVIILRSKDNESINSISREKAKKRNP